MPILSGLLLGHLEKKNRVLLIGLKHTKRRRAAGLLDLIFSVVLNRRMGNNRAEEDEGFVPKSR